MLRRVTALAATGALVVGVTACGSSASHGSSSSSGSSAGGSAASSNPSTLLRQTFAASHTVKSGVLDLSLVITTKGSSELTTPLSMSLSGPFQSRGGGRSAQSALTIALAGLGKHGSLGVTTTAAGAYVTLEGTSYKLPSADFKKLQTSLGSKSSTDSEPGLSSLGINPEDWVSRPKIVGTATVDGVLTEHLHADVDVRAFMLSLNKVLAKESSTLQSAGSTAAKIPTHITAAEASKIAAEIRQPTVDVWTGKNDSTLRRLVVNATLPVHGSLSSQLDGLSSASIRLSIDYSHLNEPQTITAPANAQSFTQLTAKLETLGESLEGLGAGSSTTGSTTGGSSGQVSKYAACIQKANGQVAKMQKCAALLQNAG
jgi:hypothetical protein